MKVKSLEEGSWVIINEGRVLGRIEAFYGFRTTTKSLYVLEKRVCSVKNHQDAINKLVEFREALHEQQHETENHIRELTMDISRVESSLTKELISNRIDELEGSLAEITKLLKGKLVESLV